MSEQNMITENFDKENDCWRKTVEQKLKRLHSLVFGVELALERGDGETALGLGLRLAGFLDSECRTPTDEIFINRIRSDSLAKIETASQMLAAETDRRAFEQAGCKDGVIFHKGGDIDLESIKESRFFKHFLEKPIHSAETQVSQVPKEINLPDVPSNRTKRAEGNHTDPPSMYCKQLTQLKLSSLYGNDNAKPAEPAIKGKTINAQTRPFQELLPKRTAQSHDVNAPKVVQLDDEDDTLHGNHIKRKRYSSEVTKHNITDDTSIMEDSINEDGEPTGFVTAKSKLVNVISFKGLILWMI